MVSIRILVVDDYGPWRRMVLTLLEDYSDCQIVDEAADGLEAIRKITELQPDLVLLDIGLPVMSGIETARRACAVSSSSKVLFVSANLALDVVQEALSTGAHGYVLKSDAAHELLPAIAAVVEGKQFMSARLASCFKSPPM